MAYYSPLCIYGLIDPITNELRYIGKTYMGLDFRFKQHVNQHTRLPVSLWIQDLLSREVMPIAIEIDNGPEGDWREVEQFWIAYFKNIGARLLNVTNGGDHRVSRKAAMRITAGFDYKPAHLHSASSAPPLIDYAI